MCAEQYQEIHLPMTQVFSPNVYTLQYLSQICMITILINKQISLNPQDGLTHLLAAASRPVIPSHCSAACSCAIVTGSVPQVGSRKTTRKCPADTTVN